MKGIIPITIGITLILITACKDLLDLPVASFTVSPNTAEIGDTIYFQNTSQGASTFDWDFGDGSGSSEENPRHIYTAEDMFTILLVATNADGSDEASGVVLIKHLTGWTTGLEMPTARWNHSASVVDGKIYVIGGGPVYGQGALNTVEEYDPVTDTWTTKAPMPTARQSLSTSVVNGKIYAIGGGESPSTEGYSGLESYSTVEEYDPAIDLWTTKSAMPNARWSHSASVVDGKIYVFGGSLSYPFGNGIDTLNVYEPATDSWTRKGDIPRPIINSFTAVVDGKIYAIGGEGKGPRVDEYNPTTDTWIRKENMPTARDDLSGSVLDGNIYVIGGEDPYTGEILANMEVYDPATDIWTTGPGMPTARWGFSSSMVDGKIYAIGGLPDLNGIAFGKVEVYKN